MKFFSSFSGEPYSVLGGYDMIKKSVFGLFLIPAVVVQLWRCLPVILHFSVSTSIELWNPLQTDTFASVSSLVDVTRLVFHHNMTQFPFQILLPVAPSS